MPAIKAKCDYCQQKRPMSTMHRSGPYKGAAWFCNNARECQARANCRADRRSR